MAAPKYVPTQPTDMPRSYSSPDHVPERWWPDRPGDLDGRQPQGPRLGAQGPDQGYAFRLASRLRPHVRLQPGEHIDDAIRGCVGIALRRAAMFGRAPVIHDLRLAFTIWGFFDEHPPAELIDRRRELFAGVGDAFHHYAEWRAIVDMVPESTLRASLADIQALYPGRWRSLTGA
jgi:hypothetical protein